jgi:hypothetical protein
MFDREGVTRHLTSPFHIEAFMKTVTGMGVRPYLPVQNQEALAQAVVAAAAAEGRELTGAFIREWIWRKVFPSAHTARSIRKEEKEKAQAKEDFNARAQKPGSRSQAR